MDYSVELSILKMKRPDVDENALTYELDQARHAINSKRRFETNETEGLFIDPKYRYLLVPFVLSALDKDGAVGQVAHSENDISRVYDNDGAYPTAMLSQIVPLAKSTGKVGE